MDLDVNEKIRLKQEGVRSGITWALIASYVLFVLVAFIISNFIKDFDADLFQTILNGLTGLLGVTLGFYFGGQNRS